MSIATDAIKDAIQRMRDDKAALDAQRQQVAEEIAELLERKRASEADIARRMQALDDEIAGAQRALAILEEGAPVAKPAPEPAPKPAPAKRIVSRPDDPDRIRIRAELDQAARERREAAESTKVAAGQIREIEFAERKRTPGETRTPITEGTEVKATATDEQRELILMILDDEGPMSQYALTREFQDLMDCKPQTASAIVSAGLLMLKLDDKAHFTGDREECSTNGRLSAIWAIGPALTTVGKD